MKILHPLKTKPVSPTPYSPRPKSLQYNIHKTHFAHDRLYINHIRALNINACRLPDIIPGNLGRTDWATEQACKRRGSAQRPLVFSA